MTSKEALYLLMTNQKKVRDGFKFIDLNTHEKVSIEECYDIIIKDLEVLEIIRKVFNYRSVQKFVDHMTKDEIFTVQEWLKNEGGIVNKLKEKKDEL